MPKRKVANLVLPHNYCIVAPKGLPWACRCDKIEYGYQPPPPESYATLDEAINRLQVLFEEVAKMTFPPAMLRHLPPQAVTVTVVLFDDILAGKNPKPLTKKRIIKEFKRHPSVPIVGLVKFWESDWESITCLLQGQKEIAAWLQSPEAQELSGVVRSIGAKAITVSGINVT
jgi:hypothetical protein